MWQAQSTGGTVQDALPRKQYPMKLREVSTRIRMLPSPDLWNDPNEGVLSA